MPADQVNIDHVFFIFPCNILPNVQNLAWNQYEANQVYKVLDVWLFVNLLHLELLMELFYHAQELGMHIHRVLRVALEYTAHNCVNQFKVDQSLLGLVKLQLGTRVV